MPRFEKNRWWIFILTFCAVSAAYLVHVSPSSSDVIRENGYTVGPSGGGGAPIPGVGDPDVPVATSLKRSQRGGLGVGNAALASRPVGDSRYVGVRDVWMWRLSVVARAMRIYWVR